MSAPFSFAELMPFRVPLVQQAVDGYASSGVLLTGLTGATWDAAGFGDDLGLYCILPPICHTLGLSTTMGALLIFIAIIALGWLIGAIAWWQIYTSNRSRAIALTWTLLVAIFSILPSIDLYLVSGATVLAFVPVLLWLRRRGCDDIVYFTGMFSVGLACFIANFIRGQAGTAVLLFAVVTLVCDSWPSKRNRVKVIALLLLAGILFQLGVGQIMARRDAFLRGKVPEYRLQVLDHPLYLSIYMGYSFLANDLGIEYNDNSPIAKSKELAPNAPYCTAESNAALSRAVWDIILHRPYLTFRTFTAKAGVVLAYLLIFMNFGAVYLFLRPKQPQLDLPFLLALGFSGLPGVLVMPLPQYLFGLVAFAAIYGLININLWLETQTAFKCGD